MKEKKALLFGATGLIGRELVHILTERKRYKRIHLFVRRPIEKVDSLCEQHLIDFSHLEKYADLFREADVFCCLGTTMKKAKTKEAFRQVDYTYPLQIATLAKHFQAVSYLVVTAMGSDPKSPFFYSRVKGELEEELIKLQLPALHIFRPSLLLGKREEVRVAEQMMGKISPILNKVMVGPLRPYRAIEGRKVALAMALVAESEKKGLQIYHSHQIEQIAQKGQAM